MLSALNQGHRNKKVQNTAFQQDKTSIGNNSDSIKHKAMKFACSMNFFSATEDRMVSSPSPVMPRSDDTGYKKHAIPPPLRLSESKTTTYCRDSEPVRLLRAIKILCVIQGCDMRSISVFYMHAFAGGRPYIRR